MSGSDPSPANESLRVDKWLWYARFCKSRGIAARLCASGKVRVNRVLIQKAHYALRVGDVLTFPLGPHIRVIQVCALGSRRGPAPEARTLYEDLDPPQPRPARTIGDVPPGPSRPSGAGRPTKADRRAIDRLRDEG